MTRINSSLLSELEQIRKREQKIIALIDEIKSNEPDLTDELDAIVEQSRETVEQIEQIKTREQSKKK